MLVPQANVFDVETPSASTGTNASLLVSVEVSSTLAATVATAAAADQVSLVLLPSGSGSQPGNQRGDSITPRSAPSPRAKHR